MSDRDEAIVRVLQGRATLDEQRELALWRRAHPDHDARYRSLEALWTVTAVEAPASSGTVPFDDLIRAARMVAADEGRITSPIAEPVAAAVRPRSGRTGWLRRRPVAAALIAAGVAALVVGIGLVRRSAGSLLSEGAIATGPGEMSTITLSDASSIRLAPNSRLRLSESRNVRMAWLEGRAFFGIHADPDRPFVVYTEFGEARVLGTRFEVNTNEDAFSVLVVEGSVAVSAAGVGVDIAAGEMMRRESGGQLVAAAIDDVYERLDWIGNAVVFQATPLKDAVFEIENRFSVDVEVVDPTLEDVLVTAAFSGADVSDVLRVVCEVVNAVCMFDGPTVRIEAP